MESKKNTTMRMVTFYLVVITLAVSPLLSIAQEVRPKLSLEDLWMSGKFRGKRFRAGSWADNGPVITFIERNPESGANDLISYNLEKEQREVILDGTRLHADDVDRLINTESYVYSKDRKKILIYTESARVWRLNTKGYYYIYDIKKESLTPLSQREAGYQMFAKLSPDGKMAAFIRNRNLFLVDLKTQQEKQLTFDGSEGKIINGTTDWVYEEELFLRDGWSWSPDGKHIAFIKFDESGTSEFFMTDLRGMKPQQVTFKYPLAGEANSKVKVGIYNIKSGNISYFNTETWDENDQYEYIARMGWTPKLDGGFKVWMLRMNRDQNSVDLLYGDPETQHHEVVLNETEDTWVEVFNIGKTDQKITFLNDDEHFIWRSEKDGFNHLYLYSNRGKLIRQVTEGEWKVTAFHGVDKTDKVYFTATAESPAERHLYTVALNPGNGATPVRITDEKGWHSINMSSDFSYYIDSYSNRNEPVVTSLHKSDGTIIKVLEKNSRFKEMLSEYQLPKTEFLKLKAADGKTTLHGYMIKPSDFNPDKSYPLLLYTYGGPWAQQVTDRWGGDDSSMACLPCGRT